MAIETRIVCDRCGKEIFYKNNWTSTFGNVIKRGKKIKIVKSYDGKTTKVASSSELVELCSECTIKLIRWLSMEDEER